MLKPSFHSYRAAFRILVFVVPVALLFLPAYRIHAGEPENRLNNLKEKFPKIVFVRHYDFGAGHYTYTEGQSDAQSINMWDWKFEPGSAMCLLELGEGGEYHERTLLADPTGVIRDPDVSFDGGKIIFSWKKSAHEDDYHLYEYEVATGTVRQLTFGLGYADYEPCVQPNGDIIFNSSRCV